MLSKTLAVLLVVLFVTDFSHGQTKQPHFRADYTYIETFGSYYKFHSTRKSWHDAKRMCSEEGASLFYPETGDEAKDIISFWKRAKNNTQPGTTGTWQTNWLYVGISDIDTEGVFETIDGKSISEVYNIWNTNQPDNFNNAENCVHMYEGGVLNDISCDDEFSFICKKSIRSLDRMESSPPEQSNLEGQTNKPQFRADYTYKEKFGSYYKFHSTSKEWRDAKRMCSEEGASLFYPENEDEANAVISFWKQAKNDTHPGTTWVYVGISDIITEGLYETIDGRISKVYNNWNLDQPDDFYGYEDCVHMNEDGRLNDIPCLSKFSFICKKSFLPQVPTNNCQQSKLDGQTNKPHFRADYTYKEKYGSYYKFHNTPKEWRDANHVCSEEGASLFYPENEDEANAVILFWKQAKNDTHPGTTWLYMDTSDTIAEEYEDIDVRFSEDNNGNLDQPDDFYASEDCVHMNENGELNEIPCHYKFSFICKKSFLPEVETNNNCQQSKLDEHENQNQVLKDYSYIESFGSYKFHSKPKPWRDAKRMCFEEGSRLFYPETADEAKAVISFWNQAKKDTQPGIWYSDWFYVGMSDIISEGVYETIDGKCISEVYYNWNTLQPDNYNDVEDCVHMNGDGRLNDISCDTEFTFICKKSNLGQLVTLREHEYDTTTKTTFYSGSEENYQ